MSIKGGSYIYKINKVIIYIYIGRAKKRHNDTFVFSLKYFIFAL